MRRAILGGQLFLATLLVGGCDPAPDQGPTIADVVSGAKESGGGKDSPTTNYIVSSAHQGKHVRWEGTVSYYDEASSVVWVHMGTSTISLPLVGKVETSQLANVKLQQKPTDVPALGDRVVIEGKVGRNLAKSKGADRIRETMSFSTGEDGRLKKEDHKVDVAKMRTTMVDIVDGRIVAPGEVTTLPAGAASSTSSSSPPTPPPPPPPLNAPSPVPPTGSSTSVSQ